MLLVDDQCKKVNKKLWSKLTGKTNLNKIRFGQVNVFRFGAWDSHCSHQIDTACPIKAGECWAMGVITCRKNCDAKFLLRGKFEPKIYDVNLEKNHKTGI